MWRLGFNQEVYKRVRTLRTHHYRRKKESALKALGQLDILKQEAVRE
jgi:hypothetical protein